MARNKHRNRGRPRPKKMRQQTKDALRRFFCPGVSRHTLKAKYRGQRIPYIVSYGTLESYENICTRFTQQCKKRYGCRTPKKCKPYVSEFLRECIAADLSPCTVHTYASALAKLYGCRNTDFGVELPERTRGAATKNLSLAWMDHFDPTKYPEANMVSLASGCRRHELDRIHPTENIAIFPDGSVWLVNIRGKGGQVRDIPILPMYVDQILALRNEAIAAGRNRLLPMLKGPRAKHRVPKGMPVHQNRAIYAIRLYNLLARPIKEIPRNEQYRCRKDMTGIILDKRAMKNVSEALGHHRLGVVTRYLREEYRKIMEIRTDIHC